MKTAQKISLVIPTIRDLTFLSAWGKAFLDCDLIIVEDRNQKSVSIPHSYFRSITHLCWQDIQADFGSEEWIFSRKNAGIRSYGFWKAWQNGADIIITLDDDCFPVDDPEHFVSAHIENLSTKAPQQWFATYPDPKWMFTRGFPYSIRQQYPVMVSHGLWSGALDLDGETESALPSLLTEKAYPPMRQFIPFGYYYPMCSMNLAFRREVVPLMFFPMMGSKIDGSSWGFDRYDDIWAGILSKKVMDYMGLCVINGWPMVDHRKRSLPSKNRQKEKLGLVENEQFWKCVASLDLMSKSSAVADVYAELIHNVDFPKTTYFTHLKKAVRIWINKFK
jgi:hypothetical protein